MLRLIFVKLFKWTLRGIIEGFAQALGLRLLATYFKPAQLVLV